MNLLSEIQIPVKLSSPVYGTFFCIDRGHRKKIECTRVEGSQKNHWVTTFKIQVENYTIEMRLLPPKDSLCCQLSLKI